MIRARVGGLESIDMMVNGTRIGAGHAEGFGMWAVRAVVTMVASASRTVPRIAAGSTP